MDAFVFDLGDTLVEYEGLPLSWVEHYPEALSRLASFLGTSPPPHSIDSACRVLGRYNTRLSARPNEVPFAQILAEICTCFSMDPFEDEEPAARAFFSVFRQRLRCFPDALPALAAIRRRGLTLALFTDVPYGMPRALVLEDIRQAGLEGLFDLVVTSVEVGLRKPEAGTLGFMAGRLGFGPSQVTHVGNERKDVDVAKAFGCASVLLERSGGSPAWGQERTIRSLAELP
jgi:putative hydrolase of the HAD superfamily